MKHNMRWITKGLGLAMCLYGVNASAHTVGHVGTSGITPGLTCESAGCHTAGAALPTVSISGAQSVTAGATTRYTLTITGGPAINAGLNVAAPAGALVVAETGTILDTPTTAGALPEITQSVGKPFTTGTATFLFDWTAPTTNGPVTLYGAGFSGDGSGRTGDGTGLATLEVTVTGAANQPPRAVIEGPTATAAGITITLDGSKSSDPDAGDSIASFDWNFGDGTAGSGPTVTKSFPAGSYDVTLTVTDQSGVTSTALQNIVVAAAGTNVPPTAKAGGPYSATVGTAITFDGTGSSDLDGTITYSWDFGDGSTPATGPTVSYTYANAGPYTATLTVTDNANATATSEATVTITTPATATEGETFFVADCSGCHGPGGDGGDITGASAADIADAFIEIPDHAGVVTIPHNHLEAIAAFLNGEATPAPATGDGAGFFATDCESCHGATGTAGSIAGETATDIAEAFIDIPDHAAAGVADIPQDHIDAIAAFLNGEATPSPATGDGAGFFATECDSCHGATGAAGSIAGESAEDIAEAFIDIPDHAAAGVADIPQAHIDAIAAFLATEEEVDADAVNNGNGGPTANEKNDNTSTRANTRTGSGGGVTDLWLISSMLLLGAWRKRSFQNKC